MFYATKDFESDKLMYFLIYKNIFSTCHTARIILYTLFNNFCWLFMFDYVMQFINI